MIFDVDICNIRDLYHGSVSYRSPFNYPDKARRDSSNDSVGRDIMRNDRVCTDDSIIANCNARHNSGFGTHPDILANMHRFNDKSSTADRIVASRDDVILIVDRDVFAENRVITNG